MGLGGRLLDTSYDMDSGRQCQTIRNGLNEGDAAWCYSVAEVDTMDLS